MAALCGHLERDARGGGVTTFTSQRIDAPPFEDPWVDKNRLPTSEIFNWFQTTLVPALESSPSFAGGGSAPVSLVDQAASIGATSITPILSTALYRVSIYARVTTVDGAASSLSVTIGSTDDGIATTQTTADLTADDVSTPLSAVAIVAVDAPGPLTYATTYSSTTPGQMKYKLVIGVERLQSE